MASIPENPRDQLLFFIDNPLVAGQPGGQGIIDKYKALLDALLGGDDGGSSAKAALFGDDPFAASAPVEGVPADDTGHSDGGGSGDDGGGFTLALGLLGGFAKGEIDI
jgi:hypothetical protein